MHATNAEYLFQPKQNGLAVTGVLPTNRMLLEGRCLAVVSRLDFERNFELVGKPELFHLVKAIDWPVTTCVYARKRDGLDLYLCDPRGVHKPPRSGQVAYVSGSIPRFDSAMCGVPEPTVVSAEEFKNDFQQPPNGFANEFKWQYSMPSHAFESIYFRTQFSPEPALMHEHHEPVQYPAYTEELNKWLKGRQRTRVASAARR